MVSLACNKPKTWAQFFTMIINCKLLDQFVFTVNKHSNWQPNKLPCLSVFLLSIFTETHLRPPASSATPNSELEEARPHSAGEEELQLQLALAMSKEEAESEAKKKTNDDLKLQMALEESKKEDLQVNDEVCESCHDCGINALPS